MPMYVPETSTKSNLYLVCFWFDRMSEVKGKISRTALHVILLVVADIKTVLTLDVITNSLSFSPKQLSIIFSSILKHNSFAKKCMGHLRKTEPVDLMI